MRPIRKGDRGAAVEDVQRRLISLGADLGPTGVDGVFLGATYSAVRVFQHDRDLDEDGEVGPHTWAALVDATFSLGDRLIYLRYPYLHGEDVRALQGALNSLGFAAGSVDGIFGAFAERAVRDFQVNTGIAVDGVVGPDTVRALDGLRHAWSGRSYPAPTELQGSAARAASVLRGRTIVVVCDGSTVHVGERVANLAYAAEPEAHVTVGDGTAKGAADLVVVVLGRVPSGVRAIDSGGDGQALARHVAEAIAGGSDSRDWAVVVAHGSVEDDHALQALAVSVLDGICSGLSGS